MEGASAGVVEIVPDRQFLAMLTSGALAKERKRTVQKKKIIQTQAVIP